MKRLPTLLQLSPLCSKLGLRCYCKENNIFLMTPLQLELSPAESPMDWCFLFITPHSAKTWFPAGSLISSIFVFFYFPKKNEGNFFFSCTPAYLRNGTFLANGEVQRWSVLELSPPQIQPFPFFLEDDFWEGGKEGANPLPVPALESQGLKLHYVSGRNRSPDGASLTACLWLPFGLGSQQMLCSLSTNVWEKEPKLGPSGSVFTTNPWLPGKTDVINPS